MMSMQELKALFPGCRKDGEKSRWWNLPILGWFEYPVDEDWLELFDEDVDLEVTDDGEMFLHNVFGTSVRVVDNDLRELIMKKLKDGEWGDASAALLAYE